MSIWEAYLGTGLPLHRFEEFGRLSADEKAALTWAAEPPRNFDRHARIREEGVEPTGFYLLVDGWVTASQTLPSGGRQILKVHLPGDAIGTPSMCMTRTVEELRALTDVTVMHVPFERFGKLLDEQPRLAARFMLSVQLERVSLMDRIASIGRTSAQQRVAAFLIDLAERLEPLGLVRDGSFFVALTQEQMSDVVGLTSVHTNRCLRALESAGLISRFGQRYSIPDRNTLARFAARTNRERSPDQLWLPKARQQGSA